MADLLVSGIILFITASALAILLFPVTIQLDSFRSGKKIDGSFGICWLMFRMRYAPRYKRIELYVFNQRLMSRSFREKPPKYQKKLPKPERIKKPRKKPPAKDILNTAGPVMRLLKDLVFTFRLKYLDMAITFGLNNPAHTGMLTGFLHALQGSTRTGHKIYWTPHFTGEVLEWDMHARVEFTPIQILTSLARFITNRQVLRTGWRIIRD